MHYGDLTLPFIQIWFFSSFNTTLAKYFWEMLKIPRTELNETMNSVDFTTDIENVTKYKIFLL